MRLALFGLGTGPILLTEVDCFGNETALLQCHAHRAGPTSMCRHSDDVSVICPCMWGRRGGGRGSKRKDGKGKEKEQRREGRGGLLKTEILFLALFPRPWLSVSQRSDPSDWWEDPE